MGDQPCGSLNGWRKIDVGEAPKHTITPRHWHNMSFTPNVMSGVALGELTSSANQVVARGNANDSSGYSYNSHRYSYSYISRGVLSTNGDDSSRRADAHRPNFVYESELADTPSTWIVHRPERYSRTTEYTTQFSSILALVFSDTRSVPLKMLLLLGLFRLVLIMARDRVAALRVS